MTERKRLVITIDGPAAAGKSSAAKLLAKRLGYLYLDSGALYRGIAWKAIRMGINHHDEAALGSLCQTTAISVRQGEDGIRVFVDGSEVTGELRTPQVTQVASVVSAVRPVRDRLLELQRKIGEEGGVVIEGRDTGTVVFPDGDAKFYLDAALTVRAERRFRELRAKGFDTQLESTLREISVRDEKDMHRPIAPLRKADDAKLIDSSDLNLSQVVDKILEEVKEKMRERS